MNIKDSFIIKSGIEKQYSELDVKRFNYLNKHPKYFLGDEVVCSGVELTDIHESIKNNSKGEEYMSRFGKLVFYMDNDEIALSFGFNLWKPVKDGVITVKSDNPLCKLIQYISNDERNNKFDIDYAKFQEIISTIEEIIIIPKVIKITKSGYEIYGFEVINIEWV